MIIEFIPKEAFIFILFLDLTLAAWYLSGSGTSIGDIPFFFLINLFQPTSPFRN